MRASVKRLMKAEYLRFSPGVVRFKIMRLLEDDECPILHDEELRGFEALLDTFKKADEELEKAINRFPKVFYRYFNKPAYIELDGERAEGLIELLERKSGYELSERAAKIKHHGKTYLIAFEFPCG